MLKLLIIIAFLLVPGCQKAPRVTAAAQAEGQTDSIVGGWKLKSAGGADPSSINIRTYEVVFEQGGTWKYDAAMSGRYEGMQLHGSGFWSLEGDKLHFTAGEITGDTKARISQDSLTLSPDPVLRANGTDKIETVYDRSRP